jgi:hypothetical protein
MNKEPSLIVLINIITSLFTKIIYRILFNLIRTPIIYF